MQGGYSNEDKPLDDIWHLDLSDYYDLGKCRNGTANVKWICIRKSSTQNREEESMEVDESISPHRRFWHTANLLSDAIISYGGMNQNPTISGPCLNTLFIQQIQPAPLFDSCIRNLQRDHLPDLPSVFSTFHLKRKLTLVDELHRFKQRKNSCSYLKESDRHCPSLYELTLSEIFSVLDLNVN
jgi:hypothetical protein